jgi:MFS family permease
MSGCRFNPFCLIGIGLSVWTFATAGCGFSFDFWSITTFHMLVGVGEASFISLAAPFIIDVAPPAQVCISYGDMLFILSLV